MFQGEPLVTSIFKLINVLVIVGGGIYLFRKKALGKLKSGVAQKKETLVQLYQSRDHAKQEKQERESQLAEQRQYGKKVAENIMHWHKNETKKLEHEAREGANRQQELAAKRQVQSEALRLIQVKRRVVLQAIIDAKSTLADHFVPDQAMGYEQEIITFMKKIDSKGRP